MVPSVLHRLVPAFWIQIKAKYPDIAMKALKTLLPFPISYLCEVGFLEITVTKTRLQNKLDRRNTLPLSPIIPHWDRLVAGKQAQGSH